MASNTSQQLEIDFQVEVQKSINGIEMGVLDNGIPYLTQTGLAALTGVKRSVIYDISTEWENTFNDDIIGGKDRNSLLREMLIKKGYKESKLYLEITTNGQKHYAYPDIVCMAILEYYAFDSKNKTDTALTHFRELAGYGLQAYIYQSLKYSPFDKWKYHNDRVSILQNNVPQGYFIIFQEITGMIVDLINADVTVNHKTIPDISVGKLWAKFWKANSLSYQYGEHIHCAHNYPDYYPQAASNPQSVYAYPENALPEFRRWFRETYLPTKFPTYILNKANILSGGKSEALRIGSMYQTKQIGSDLKS
jgi:hypothetical protein